MHTPSGMIYMKRLIGLKLYSSKCAFRSVAQLRTAESKAQEITHKETHDASHLRASGGTGLADAESVKVTEISIHLAGGPSTVQPFY
jgi:hypothetical protein